MSKRVLICGDRNYSNAELIRFWIAKLQDRSYDTVIEGEAKGADSIARDEAEKAGLLVDPYPASWNLYGRAAGAIRNTKMLKEGKPDLVVAFNTNIKNSKGTKNMIEQAKKAGIEVILIEE